MKGDDPAEGPGLFDLPLAPEGEKPRRPETPEPSRPAPPPAAGRAPAPSPGPAAPALPLFPERDEGEATQPVAPVFPRPPRRDAARAPERAGPSPAGTAARLQAGLLDLAVHGGVVVAMSSGLLLAGIELGGADVLALALFLAVFSFLYHLVPLAFWGQTPGMAGLGIVARGDEELALSFPQAALRWAGRAATVAAAGLPALLLLSGRSLADRLSGSRVYRQDRPAAVSSAVRQRRPDDTW